MDRLTEIADPSVGYLGGGFWSDDGQTYYVPTATSLYQINIADLDHPMLLAPASVTAPPWKSPTFDLSQPVAVSPDQQLAAYMVNPTDPEARIVALRVVNTSDQAEVATLMTDSLLVPQRYSDDRIAPQFTETNTLLYLREGSLYQWTPETGAEILLIDHQSEDDDFQYTDIRLNAQGTYAATYDIWGTVSRSIMLTFYDLRTTPVTVLYQHEFPAQDRWQSVAISPDGRSIAAGGNNANVRVWDIVSGTDTFHEDNPPGEFAEQNVVDLAYSPDGRYIAGCVNNVSVGYAFLRDAQTGATLATITGSFSGNGFTFFSSVAFHPSDDVIAFGTGAGTVILWSVADLLAAGNVRAEDAPIVLPGDTLPIVDLSFNAQGTQIATASWDHTVRVWDYQTRQPVAEFNADSDRVWSAAFSPSGDTLATSGEDGAILLWDLNSQQSKLLDQMTAANQYSRPGVVALAYNTDGSLLAGSTRDGHLYLWNVQSGQRIDLQPGGTIWHLAFSGDGTLLTAASDSTAVWVWGVPAS